MLRYFAILGLSLFAGYFVISSSALASQNSVGYQFICSFGSTGPCAQAGGSGGNPMYVAGQAYTIQGSMSGGGGAAGTFFICLSGPSAGTDCSAMFNSGSGTKTYTAPPPGTSPYRYGTISFNINSGSTGSTVSVNATTTGRVVEVPAPPTVNPNNINVGQTSAISWSTTDSFSSGINVSDVNNPGGATGYKPGGSSAGSYTYTANQGAGLVFVQTVAGGLNAAGNYVNLLSPNVSITVNQAVTADAKCNGSDGPCGVNYGSNFTLSWSSTLATSCTTTGPGFSQSGLSGSASVGPITASGQVYTTTCTNGATTRNDSVTVNINAPTVDLKCGTPAGNGPCTVPTGSTSLLSWTSTGATVCTASNGWSGSKTPVASGSQASPPITQVPYKPALAMREEVINKLLGIDTAHASAGPDNDGQVWIRCNNTGGPCTVPYGGSVELEMTSHHPNGAGSWAANCTADWPSPTYAHVPVGRNYNETLTGLTASRVYGFRCSSAGFFSADFVTVNVTAPVANAAFVSQTSIPSYMNVGTTYPVSITLQNNGNLTWTAATNYKLGAAAPQGSFNFGVFRVNLGAGDSIAPGQSKTFSFNAAPTNPGSYTFQFQMLQEGVTWFGTPSTGVPVTVLAAGAKAFTLTCTNPAGGSASDTVIVQSGPNQNPVGSLDCAGNGCAGGANIAGWTYDADATTASIDYRITIDGGPPTTAATSVLRADVNTAFGITGNHGFSMPIPPQYFDGLTHTVRAYGINTPAGTNPELVNSPRTFLVTPTPTPSPTPSNTPTPVTIPIIKEVTPR